MSFHRLFEVCAGRTLSHAELWSIAGAAAQHLGGAVGTVAILLERGISMALLAQLRRQTSHESNQRTTIQQERGETAKQYRQSYRKVCLIQKGM